MKIPRSTALKINYVLDQLLPPFIRDNRFLMSIPMRALFGKDTDQINAFKDSAFHMTEDEYGDFYRRTAAHWELQGETDLNQRCVDAIVESVVGEKVLEVGCGRGYLAGILAEKWSVCAVDIVIPPELPARKPRVRFEQASIEHLPFADGEFDTVVCTHTLEHVQRLDRAIAELRRVAGRRLIVVVPRQRPYRYTFNLHLHFFPYKWALESWFGHRPGAVIRDLGDWLYVEDAGAVQVPPAAGG
jgi:ubiquinone/menaquinone biosynthesis C-methylase UbiE